jgi:hypothetical protein
MTEAPNALGPAELYSAAGDSFFEIANHLYDINKEEEIKAALLEEGVTPGPFLIELQLQERAPPYLQRAIRAFRYAAATGSGVTKMRARLALADASYGVQGAVFAKTVYQAITEEFVSSQGPLEEYPYFIAASAKWAVTLIKDGLACEYGRPLRDTDWDAVWVNLGAAPDHDICKLPENTYPKEYLDKLGQVWRVKVQGSTAISCLHGASRRELFKRQNPIEFAYCLKTARVEETVLDLMKRGALTPKLILNLFDNPRKPAELNNEARRAISREEDAAKSAEGCSDAACDTRGTEGRPNNAITSAKSGKKASK